MCRNIGRRRTDDQLHGEKTPSNEAVLRRGTNAQANIHTVLHPFANPVIEFDIGLNFGMAAAKLINERPKYWQERVLRGDDSQRPGNIVLRHANAVHRALQCGRRGLRGLEKLLSLGSGAMLFVVRCKRRTPSRSSSAASAWLAA